jgi:glycosyltransferase involved in cell wall biosynthesis
VQRYRLPYVVTLTDFFFSCFRVNLINLQQELCSGPEKGLRCARDCLVPPWTRDSLAGRYRHAEDFLGAAGARICPSDYVAEQYRKAFPMLRFIVVPHGIDLCTLAAIDPTRAHGDVDEDDLTLGFIGAIVPHKRLHTLLHALARIPDARIKLRIVGGLYGDPTYNNEVKRLVAADSRVELLGQVLPDQVFAIIRKIDVLCLPSSVPETFSLILHEAAAAGVPALVSDLGAPGRQVSQYGGGRVLSVGDVDAWAQAIVELAEHPELLSTWRSKLMLPLRVEEEAFLYESLYRSLLRPSTRTDP